MITTAHLRGTEVGERPRTSLIDQLARKADANKDGTVSSAEFTAFLSSLTESLDHEEQAAKTPSASATDLGPGAAPAVPALRSADGQASAAQALRRAIQRTETEGK